MTLRERSDGRWTECAQSSQLLATLGVLIAGCPHTPPLEYPGVHCKQSWPATGWPLTWGCTCRTHSISHPDGELHTCTFQESPPPQTFLSHTFTWLACPCGGWRTVGHLAASLGGAWGCLPFGQLDGECPMAAHRPALTTHLNCFLFISPAFYRSEPVCRENRNSVKFILHAPKMRMGGGKSEFMALLKGYLDVDLEYFTILEKVMQLMVIFTTVSESWDAGIYHIFCL